MKLPKSHRNATRELDRVIAKALKAVESPGAGGEAVEKEDFEELLNIIILQVSRNRRVDIQQVAATTDQVIADLPKEYGQLDEEQRSWEALIAFLYLKYQMVLGIDVSIFQPWRSGRKTKFRWWWVSRLSLLDADFGSLCLEPLGEIAGHLWQR